MENALMTTGMMDVSVSDAELAELQELAQNNVSNFAKNTKEGIELAQETYPEIYCQIISWDRYFYRWENGKTKTIDREMTKAQAKSKGYSEGMDLTLSVMKPALPDPYILSMPQSSVWNFAKYVQFLLSKNATPKHVVTKMKSSLKQFRRGSPVSVLSFSSAGTIQPEQEPVINVTPEKDEPAQPVKAPVEDPQQTEIPSEWA
jgi:hypothetical protein